MAIRYLILILTIFMAIGYGYWLLLMAISYGYPLFDFATNYCYGYWFWLLAIVDGYSLLLWLLIFFSYWLF
jgi:hypothetical protein